MPESGVDIDLFRRLEQVLHRPEVRSSHDAVSALLAEDFREFGRSGTIYDKATVLEALAQKAPAAASPLPVILDFAAQALAPDIVLVTYRSINHAHGDDPERSTLRSSIWQQVGGSWLMLFHQGTPVPPRA
ncbi:DUF4440 domain-containing protein [Devosia neptuniae]|uniref:DUF4440 domain-containing protein n=1 Tax=Devosia neptuniae TaxID=191302 RepID=A0ABY6CIY6_9HYPH|nr:DUF4440 domain-containing protein [Devosia neptuniae]UXN71723.1 DUF4440 domain-containing protein [Devosia neptuniae]